MVFIASCVFVNDDNKFKILIFSFRIVLFITVMFYLLWEL